MRITFDAAAENPRRTYIACISGQLAAMVTEGINKREESYRNSFTTSETTSDNFILSCALVYFGHIDTELVDPAKMVLP